MTSNTEITPLRPRTIYLETLLASLLAGLLFAVNLESPPEFDELYHILAAQGIIETGEPRIADGLYTRAYAFTFAISMLFRCIGDAVWVARLGALIPMALGVGMLYLWIRRTAGKTPAVVTAVLYTTAPFTIEIAQFARFYGLQVFCFLGATLCLSSVVIEDASLRQRILLLGVAAGGYLIALYLQVTTLIGLVGVGLWLVVSLVFSSATGRVGRRRWLIPVGALVLLSLIFVWLIASGLALRLWVLFRFAPIWAQATVNEPAYYHALLNFNYPTLWPLFPFAGVLALAIRPTLALPSLCVFCSAFVLHSIAGAKDVRYMAYAWPFFFVPYGLVLPGVFRRTWRILSTTVSRVHVVARARQVVMTLMLAGVIGAFVILANTAFVRSTLMLALVRVSPQAPLTNWPAVASRLKSEIASSDIVVTTSELDALYYWGRHDLLVGRSRLNELIPPVEFGVDKRTGRPVIASGEAMEMVLGCFGPGLLITRDTRYRASAYLDDDVADVLVRKATLIPLPKEWHALAWQWGHPVDPNVERCKDVREKIKKESGGMNPRFDYGLWK